MGKKSISESATMYAFKFSEKFIFNADDKKNLQIKNNYRILKVWSNYFLLIL